MISYNSLLPMLSVGKTPSLLGLAIKPCAERYYRFTQVKNQRVVECKYCGAKFLRNYKKTVVNEFCSFNCSNKYNGEIKHKKSVEKAKKMVSEKELKEFLKKYSNYVYCVAYNEFAPFSEDIIDYFYYNSLVLLANIKKNNITKNAIIIKYFYKSLKYYFLRLKEERKNEIFYSDLSMKNQIKILGDVIEERY